MTFEIYVNSNICCVLLQVQYNKFYMVHFKENHLNLVEWTSNQKFINITVTAVDICRVKTLVDLTKNWTPSRSCYNP